MRRADRSRRARLLAVAAVCAVIGFASKRYTGPGRAVARGQFEDFFGAIFLILAPRAVFLRAAFAEVAAPILAILVAIELSQLSHDAWLERARGTWLGLHVLGRWFEWADLLAYALAAGVAWWIDRRLA